MKTRLPANKRRAQLVDAAIALAEREGFGAVTIRNIAEEAGVSLGVVHYCFEDKDELIATMIGSITSDIVESTTGVGLHLAEEVAENGGPDDEAGDLDPETIRGLLGAIVDQLWSSIEKTWSHQLLTYELTTYALRNYLLDEHSPARRQYRAYDAAVRETLERLLPLAGVELTVPTEDVSRLITAAMDGVALRWLVDRDSDAARRTLRSMLESVTFRSTRTRER